MPAWNSSACSQHTPHRRGCWNKRHPERSTNRTRRTGRCGVTHWCIKPELNFLHRDESNGMNQQRQIVDLFVNNTAPLCYNNCAQLPAVPWLCNLLTAFAHPLYYSWARKQDLSLHTFNTRYNTEQSLWAGDKKLTNVQILCITAMYRNMLIGCVLKDSPDKITMLRESFHLSSLTVPWPPQGQLCTSHTSTSRLLLNALPLATSP